MATGKPGFWRHAIIGSTQSFDQGAKCGATTRGGRVPCILCPPISAEEDEEEAEEEEEEEAEAAEEEEEIGVPASGK